MLDAIGKGLVNKNTNQLTGPGKAVFLAALFCLLTILLYLSPVQNGVDAYIYYAAAKRVLIGLTPHGISYPGGSFSNAPWMASLFVPLTVLPFRVVNSGIAAASITLCSALAFKFDLRPVKTILLMTCPPVLNAVACGNIDVLVLGILLLPQTWRPLMALTKPQLGAGLLLPHCKSWLRQLALLGGLLALSLFVWWLWPVSLLGHTLPIQQGNNFWLHLWRANLVVGLVIVWFGFKRQDWRLNLAASPFLLPYAAGMSFTGFWLAFSMFLSDGAVAVIWVAWWVGFFWPL